MVGTAAMNSFGPAQDPLESRVRVATRRGFAPLWPGSSIDLVLFYIKNAKKRSKYKNTTVEKLIIPESR